MNSHQYLKSLFALCVAFAFVGCSTWKSPFSLGGIAGTSSPTPTLESNAADDLNAPEPSSDESFFSPNRLVGYVTGTNEDIPKAKALYRQGDQVFREAQKAPKGEREKRFAEAADYFNSASNASIGSALQQDALFMKGESQFFANQLTGARDTLEKLQKDFPRNRHSDRAAARLFAISKYWIETSKAGGDSWYNVNLFDNKRPTFDTRGHAVKVLDQIRYDDPTGKLADDATMAAAAEHIRMGKFERADEFLTDLRETFTDSDHLFLAHMLGVQCKLEIYAGPLYSGRVLEEAKELIKQTRRRFPDKLENEKYREMLARSSAAIDFHQAAKLEYRAKYRERRKEYGAAREYYRKILTDHPNSPQAEGARAKLTDIDGLPAIPTKQLAWLTKVFPDKKRSEPLETIDSSQSSTESTTPAPQPSEETLLR